MKKKKFESELEAWKKQDAQLRSTPLGRHILQVRENLIKDLGEENISESINVLLDRLCEKLFILGLMGSHIHKKKDQIITENDDLIACLKQPYLAFSNSTRLDLLAIHEISRQTTRKRPLDLDAYIENKYLKGKIDEKED